MLFNQANSRDAVATFYSEVFDEFSPNNSFYGSVRLTMMPNYNYRIAHTRKIINNIDLSSRPEMLGARAYFFTTGAIGPLGNDITDCSTE